MHSDRPVSQAPAARSGNEAEDLLDLYLRDIRRIRVLRPEEELAYSRRIHDGEATLRRVVLEIPLSARRLHARWSQIREAGRVTATLAAVRRAEGAPDRSPEIDAAMERVAALLVRRDRMTAREGFDAARPTRALRAVDRELGEILLAVEPRPDYVFEIYCELRGQVRQAGDLARTRRRGRTGPSGPGAAATRELEREVGLPVAELEARVRIAGEALDDVSEARDEFARHNLKLVVSVAKEFRNMGVPFLDLIQEGNTGLMRAVEKFDYRHGHRFSTYGVWWIRQSCIRAIQNTSRTVRLPTNLHDRLLRFRRSVAALDGEPDLSEVARAVGESESDVEALLQYDRRPLGFDDPVAGAESLTVGDRLADEQVLAPEEGLDAAALSARVPGLLEALPDRERRVLQWRFGLGDEEPRTLQEIGDVLGLSRERVRQIERGALDVLRGRAEGTGLEFLVRDEAA